MRDKVLGELQKAFRPEFLNRIDATVVFHSLRKEEVREIVDLMLTRVRHRLTEQEVVGGCRGDEGLPGGEGLRRGQDGSRPLRRVNANMGGRRQVAEGILEGRFKPGDLVTDQGPERQAGAGGQSASRASCPSLRWPAPAVARRAREGRVAAEAAPRVVDAGRHVTTRQTGRCVAVLRVERLKHDRGPHSTQPG